MTKVISVLLLGFLLIGFEPLAASSQVDKRPVKFELQLIYIFEAHKTEFIFAIGQSGFKSVAALERYLDTWPPGSELRWSPGCERLGGEPLLSSEEDMKAFRVFLKERGIKFVLVPSG